MFGTTTTIARVSRLGAGTPRHGRTFSSLWSSSLCCPDDDVGDLSRRRHGMVSRRGRHGHAHRSLYDDRSVMFRRRYASDLAGSVSIQDPTSFYTDEQRQIMQKTKELHQSIMPLNEKLRGPLSSSSSSDQGTTFLPSVLLVGNHSSGKSSFINHVLKRPVQTAGVAPTDDDFTVIAPGPVDVDRDGPTLIGDPDLGFGPLRRFGPTLMHHASLKIRRDTDAQFLMIDSPGMIDAPANYAGMMLQTTKTGGDNTNNSNNTTMDRGYDFTGVVRWFARRADVVCLFFDPDKPGTTGETLSVLLHALSGMDHKLLIVLNKADQFQDSIHDFARAYGSLCWNLSKVIPRKDLPRIYTMCLPTEDNVLMTDDGDDGDDGNTGTKGRSPTLGGLHDLHRAREDVVAEVRRAPARRLDNLLTGLHDAVTRLEMHGRVVRDAQSRASATFFWRARRDEAFAAVTGTVVAGAVQGLLSSPYYAALLPASSVAVVTGSILAVTVLTTSALAWYNARRRAVWESRLADDEQLTTTFRRVYAREVSDGDESTAASWRRDVKPHLQRVLRQEGLNALGTVTEHDLRGLRRILEDDLPALRRRASPPHYGKD